MFPILLIVIGIAVLLLGQRLAVLGAAVGALLGVVLLRLFPGTSDPLVHFGVVLGLALVGFFAAAFARGIIDVVILVLGALAGAAIVLSVLDLFGTDLGLVKWLLAVVGGVVGLMLIRRSRRTPPDWGMIILAGLIGALLVTRGLTQLLPSLQGGAISTLIVIVLAGGSMVYQGGLLKGRKAASPTPPAPPTTGAGSPAAKDDPPPPTQ
jgi:hypothetical protein